MSDSEVSSQRLARAYQLVRDNIERHSDKLVALSRKIHAHPELSFQEHYAAEHVTEAVRQAGYAVDRPLPDLPTAVRGVIPGKSKTGVERRVAVLAEYDALESIGHACGHNLMAMAGVGAAIGLSAVTDMFQGEVRFLGTPAEEHGAGKQFMIDGGLFDGLDAALLFHPADFNAVAAPALALEEIAITFFGQAAHASFAPWEGANALDALVDLYTSIGLWRQQLRPSTRIHGVITHGGDAANIIPAETSATFMLRADTSDEFSILQDRFRTLVHTAATAHGCTVQINSQGASLTMVNSSVIGERFRHHMQDAWIEEGRAPQAAGSTDMGNVSHIVPTIHPYLQICSHGISPHTPAFRDEAVSDQAHSTALLAATALAQSACDVLLLPEVAEAAHKELEHTIGQTPHTLSTPITKES